jgi:hypothetical protein
MNDLILHHDDLSALAEEIRLVFGLKEHAGRSCERISRPTIH